MRAGRESDLDVRGDRVGSSDRELDAEGFGIRTRGERCGGGVLQGQRSGDRVVRGDVAITTEDRLGILFRGVETEEVGDVLVDKEFKENF